MRDFSAILELPMFIPKEQILGKYVFDSEVVCIGSVEDWTYSSDGVVKMVVHRENEANGTSTVLIPFNHIGRVGQFVLLRTRREEYIDKPSKRPEETGEKKKEQKNNEMKYFDRIDTRKLDHVAGKRT